MRASTLILAIILLSTAVCAKKAPQDFEDVVRSFMKGANLTEYVVDSERCLDSIDDTAATFADLIYQIRDHRRPNSTVSVYPDIILTTTDVLATLSPMSRLCFQSSIEAKEDIMAYIN